MATLILPGITLYYLPTSIRLWKLRAGHGALALLGNPQLLRKANAP